MLTGELQMISEQFYCCAREPDTHPIFALTMSGSIQYSDTCGHEHKGYPYHLFEYIIGGTGILEVDNVRCHPEADHVYIIRQGHPHRHYSDAEHPWEKIWFTAVGSLVEHLLNAYELDGLCYVYAPGLQSYFQRLQDLLSHNDPDVDQKSALLFHELISELSRLNFQEKPSSTAQTAMQIKIYLDHSLEQRVNLKSISEQVYKSPSQVIRIFKTAFGQTPYEYLCKRRVNAAKLYLLNSDLSIQEIAFRLQYTDEHYFAATFKRYTDTSPSQYRKAGH